jgi:GNAT superfamily N-acetyltransferase
MHCIKVHDNDTDQLFHKVPQRVYQEDSNWIPHLRQDVKKVFDLKKNRLFKKGAEAQRWVVLNEQKQAIGRIAAFVNMKYSKGMEQPTGGIGFFDAIEDDGVAGLLFDAAEQWLIDREMKAVDGPINLGEKDKFWGLLVDNFTDVSSYGMNYNPPYYRNWFESRGYQVYYEQYVFGRSVSEPLQEVVLRKITQITEPEQYQFYTARDISYEQLAIDFYTVYNNAWGGHHGFAKMSLKQAQRTVKSLKPVMDPNILFFVRHVPSNEPIGFFINIPELNLIFRHVHGNLNLWGKLVFMWHKLRKSSDVMVGVVFGVDRKFHGKGIDSMLIKGAHERLNEESRYVKAMLTWIGDFNPKMIHIAESLGTERKRTLFTMRKMLDPSVEFKRMPVAK